MELKTAKYSCLLFEPIIKIKNPTSCNPEVYVTLFVLVALNKKKMCLLVELAVY